MTALRHRRTRRVKLPAGKAVCNACRTKTGKAFCEDCVDAREEDAADEARGEREDGLNDDAARELARVYLDIRHGRYRDAMHRLEAVLDSEAASWRELT